MSAITCSAMLGPWMRCMLVRITLRSRSCGCCTQRSTPAASHWIHCRCVAVPSTSAEHTPSVASVAAISRALACEAAMNFTPGNAVASAGSSSCSWSETRMSFGTRQPGCSRTGGPEGCSPRESSVTAPPGAGASAAAAAVARASAVVAHRASRQACGAPAARVFSIMFPSPNGDFARPPAVSLSFTRARRFRPCRRSPR